MTIEKAIEKAARAGYEKFFEGVGELEPQWHELPLEHQFRLMQSQIAAIAAFLREAEATEGMLQNGHANGARTNMVWTKIDYPQAVMLKNDYLPAAWRAMSSRMADEVEGGGR